MRFNPAPLAVSLVLLLAVPAQAAELAAENAQEKASLVNRATSSLQSAIDGALDLVGIRYKRGGSTPESGFDCSGFVGHVFRQGMGLILPRTSREISKAGEAIKRDELQPGDLVFFNTMRRTFSHVGIYLGEGQFIHSPRAGGSVRIENMSESYWAKRYEGARRVNPE
ncbi:MAG: C40 family peptidase [Rhodocyclaceae bacterium]|nr:C40 family peptidase [Rhodocyclaceae bacterium]